MGTVSIKYNVFIYLHSVNNLTSNNDVTHNVFPKEFFLQFDCFPQMFLYAISRSKSLQFTALSVMFIDCDLVQVLKSDSTPSRASPTPIPHSRIVVLSVQLMFLHNRTTHTNRFSFHRDEILISVLFGAAKVFTFDFV